MEPDKNPTPQVFVGQVWKYIDERYPEPFLVHAIHRAGERMPGTDHRFLADSVHVEHGMDFGNRSKWPNLWADRPYASFGKAFILVAESEDEYYAMRNRAPLTPPSVGELETVAWENPREECVTEAAHKASHPEITKDYTVPLVRKSAALAHNEAIRGALRGLLKALDGSAKDLQDADRVARALLASQGPHEPA